MKSWPLSLIFLCYAPFLSGQFNAARVLTKNLVSLTAEYDEISQEGYGFIVDYVAADKHFFIITAAHIVANPALTSTVADHIQLNFGPSQTVSGKVVRFDDELDLALIQAKVTRNYRWIRKSVTDISIDQAVTYLGWKGSIGPPPEGANGQITSQHMNTFRTDLKGVQPGNSGAPVVSSRGIVGMILKSDGNSTQGISIAAIEEFAKPNFSLKYRKKDVPIPCNDIEPSFWSIQAPGSIAYRLPYTITLNNAPLSLRMLGAHPDDLKFREMDLLPPPYTIGPERNIFKIAALYSLEPIQLSLFHGKLWIGLRTSALPSDSEETYDRNFHRKSYLKNPQPNDNAYIYYGFTTTANGFIPSIPITINLPLKPNMGIRNPKTLSFITGYTILNPTIKVLAQNGWDRFGTREPNSDPFEIGRIVEHTGHLGLNIQDCQMFSYGLAVGISVPRFHATDGNPEYEKIKLESKVQIGIALYISKSFQL